MGVRPLAREKERCRQEHQDAQQMHLSPPIGSTRCPRRHKNGDWELQAAPHSAWRHQDTARAPFELQGELGYRRAVELQIPLFQKTKIAKCRFGCRFVCCRQTEFSGLKNDRLRVAKQVTEYLFLFIMGIRLAAAAKARKRLACLNNEGGQIKPIISKALIPCGFCRLSDTNELRMAENRRQNARFLPPKNGLHPAPQPLFCRPGRGAQ